jgi:hypothetical protein
VETLWNFWGKLVKKIRFAKMGIGAWGSVIGERQEKSKGFFWDVMDD